MKNQLLVLFFCNLCMSAIGNGLVPLYAQALGTSPYQGIRARSARVSAYAERYTL